MAVTRARVPTAPRPFEESRPKRHSQVLPAPAPRRKSRGPLGFLQCHVAPWGVDDAVAKAVSKLALP